MDPEDAFDWQDGEELCYFIPKASPAGAIGRTDSRTICKQAPARDDWASKKDLAESISVGKRLRGYIQAGWSKPTKEYKPFDDNPSWPYWRLLEDQLHQDHVQANGIEPYICQICSPFTICTCDTACCMGLPLLDDMGPDWSVAPLVDAVTPKVPRGLYPFRGLMTPFCYPRYTAYHAVPQDDNLEDNLAQDVGLAAMAEELAGDLYREVMMGSNGCGSASRSWSQVAGSCSSNFRTKESEEMQRMTIEDENPFAPLLLDC